MSIMAIATKEFISRIIKSGTDPIRAEGLTIKVDRIRDGEVTLSFNVVDKNGEPLVEIRPSESLTSGETLTIMKLDAVFNVTVRPG